MLAQAEDFYLNVPPAMMEKYRVSRKELKETAKLVSNVRDLQTATQHAQALT